jgi:hypothetical protein
MSLVPEDRLTQYLALASGLPPAARDDGAAIDREAVALIAPELAARHRDAVLEDRLAAKGLPGLGPADIR